MERVAAYDLIVIGSMLWVGYVGSKLFQKAKLPAVSGFLIVGILLGPQVFNVLNPSILQRLSFVEPLALSVITFIIGEQLHLKRLAKLGTRSLFISVFEIVLTPLVVGYSIFLVTGQEVLAIFLGILSMTTAPATTVAVISETRSKGRMTDTISSSVALNNIICVALFSLVLPIAMWATLGKISLFAALISASKNILLSLIIGSVTSLVLVLLVPRLETTGELFVFILGHLTLAVAISLFVDASPILTTLVAGILAANLLADEVQNRRIFGSLKMISEPIYLLFFVLSGASLRFDMLLASGFVLLAYILARSAGKILGPFLGALASGFSVGDAKNMSLSFLSQSAVAIGLSLIVLEKYPILGQRINAVILGGVVFFELVGPYLMKHALEKSGEVRACAVDKDIGLEETEKKEIVKILVPIGSKLLSSRNAKTIGQFVRRIEGRVIALHVINARSPKGVISAKEISDRTVNTFSELMQQEGIDFEVRVESSGKIAETICRVARQEDVGLVIMGTSGRSKFLNRFFTGVSDRVTNLLDCPIVVLPGE